jgi:outer membrane protein
MNWFRFRQSMTALTIAATAHAAPVRMALTIAPFAKPVLVVLLQAVFVFATPAQAQTDAMAPDDSTARRVTLAEALEQAHRNAPQAIQAAGQIRTSRASVRSSYASFLPSVSLSAGATRQYSSGRTRIENGQIITVPTTPWSYNAGLGANVELFTGGRRFFDLRQARAGLTSAQSNEVAQRFAIELDVKGNYYDVLAARESEQAAGAQVEQAEQQFRMAVLRVRSGSATKSDSLRAEIQLSNARLALLQARRDIQVANAALSRSIGSSDLVTASGLDAPDAATPTLDDATLARLAEEGPAVVGARADRDALRAVKSAAWTSYLPTVTASYSRSGSGSGNDPTFSGEDLSYAGSFRLGLSLPLFNQLSREEQVVRADVAADNAEAALRDARLAARENLTRSLGDYRTSTQRVSALTSSVDAATEDLRVQQRRYQVGSGTLLDVLTSQTQLDQAREALIRARYDQRIARAQLEALIGRNLE